MHEFDESAEKTDGAENGNSAKKTSETRTFKWLLIIERVDELGLDGAVFLPIERTTNTTAFVIDEEEVIARTIDVIQPEVEPDERVGVVVLDRRAGEPLVAKVVIDAAVDNVIGESPILAGEVSIPVHVFSFVEPSVIEIVFDLEGKRVRDPHGRAAIDGVERASEKSGVVLPHPGPGESQSGIGTISNIIEKPTAETAGCFGGAAAGQASA